MNINITSWNIKTLAIIIFIIIGISLAITITETVIVSVRHAKNPQKKAGKQFGIVMSVCGLLTVAGCICAVYGTVQYSKAQKHGLYTNDITFSELVQGVNNSPEESTLPDDLSGAVIIYYKFGCSDCEAIYKDLSAAVSGHSDIYWVSTRSEQGKKLLETYPTEEVPAGIYIRQDNYNDTIPFTSKLLFTTDEDGNTVLDKQAIERLLYLQSENR